MQRRTALLALSFLPLAATRLAWADTRRTTFVASLSGAEEVPPAGTQAQGQAIFQLSKDCKELSFKLIVANIEKVMMAHIHLAAVGENGPVVALLYSDPEAELVEGRFNGILAEGGITADKLVGPLAGETLDDLVKEILAGNAYVNVHTEQFPGGEIRGQIR